MIQPMSDRVQEKTSYSPALDGLRAFAVISVLVNHIDARIQPGGYLGVDIFFVISGYVITQSLISRNEGRNSSLSSQLIEFYVRRVKRLVPALLLCIGTTALLYCFFVSGSDLAMRKSLATGVAAIFGLSNIYLAFNSVDYFGIDSNMNPFLHTWSLGVEEQFYFVFPLLLLLSVRRSRKAALAVCGALAVASLIIFVVMMNRSPALAYFILPTRMFELLLGSLAFLCRGSVLLRSIRAPNVLLVAVAAVTFVPETWITFAVPAVTILTALLLVSLAHAEDRSVLALPAIVAIGVRSYSIYLWHWPVLFFARHMAGLSPGSILAALLVTALLSALSYAFVERPLRSANWAPTPLRSLAAGLTASAAIASVLVLLAFPLRGALYLGVPPALAAAGVESLQDPLSDGGKVVWSGNLCAISPGRAIDVDPANCTVGNAANAERTVLVLGNSYSAAELHLFAEAARRTGQAFVVTTAWGASPVPGVKNRGVWQQENDHYWTQVVPSLLSRLKTGDVVLLASDIAEFAPATPTPGSAARLAELRDGLDAFAAEMDTRGLTVAIQRALPFMREAGCSPDAGAGQWFIVGDGNCRFYSRDETLARRTPLDTIVDEVQSRRTNLFSVDLFDVFCPGTKCTYRLPDGTMLYRDVFSHPSVEASRLAAPAFVEQFQTGLSKATR